MAGTPGQGQRRPAPLRRCRWAGGCWRPPPLGSCPTAARAGPRGGCGEAAGTSPLLPPPRRGGSRRRGRERQRRRTGLPPAGVYSWGARGGPEGAGAVGGAPPAPHGLFRDGSSRRMGLGPRGAFPRWPCRRGGAGAPGGRWRRRPGRRAAGRGAEGGSAPAGCSRLAEGWGFSQERGFSCIPSKSELKRKATKPASPDSHQPPPKPPKKQRKKTKQNNKTHSKSQDFFPSFSPCLKRQGIQAGGATRTVGRVNRELLGRAPLCGETPFYKRFGVAVSAALQLKVI